MRTSWLALCGALAVFALTGCSDDSPDPEPQPKPAPAALDIVGSWLYLGPSDPTHTLMIDATSFAYKGVDAVWNSTWTIKATDNAAHHFQMAFASGSGQYLPMGQTLSGAYEVSGTLLSVQLASGTSYPELKSAGTCTSASDGTPIPGCGLYIKQ